MSDLRPQPDTEGLREKVRAAIDGAWSVVKTMADGYPSVLLGDTDDIFAAVWPLVAAALDSVRSDNEALRQAIEERAKFQAETLTASYLAEVLRDANVSCTSFQHDTYTKPAGVGVFVRGDERYWLCHGCLQHPGLTARKGLPDA